MQLQQRMMIGNTVQSFYVTELKRTFKDDFELIEDRVDVYTSKKTLRDCLQAAKDEIKKVKKQQRLQHRKGLLK